MRDIVALIATVCIVAVVLTGTSTQGVFSCVFCLEAVTQFVLGEDYRCEDLRDTLLEQRAGVCPLSCSADGRPVEICVGS